MVISTVSPLMILSSLLFVCCRCRFSWLLFVTVLLVVVWLPPVVISNVCHSGRLQLALFVRSFVGGGVVVVCDFFCVGAGGHCGLRCLQAQQGASSVSDDRSFCLIGRVKLRAYVQFE